jgi:hypothetical protein
MLMPKNLLRTALWVLFAVALGLGLSYKPWQEYQQHKLKRDAAVKEMKEVETERVEAIRKRAKYDSVAGREELAREWGYKKPGEKGFEPAGNTP